MQPDIYGLQTPMEKAPSKSSRWNSFVKKCQKYSDESSIHGIRYFAGSDKAHYALRIVWLLILCSSMTLCSLVFQPIWHQYSSMATQTSIDLVEQDRFDLPSITFRNLNTFRRSLVGATYEQFLKLTAYRHDMISEGIHSCSGKTLGEVGLPPSSIERQKFDRLMRDMDTVASSLGYLGFIMITTSNSMNSVQMCRFQGRTLTDAECYSAFQNRISNYGYVFTFNPAEVISQFSMMQAAESIGVATNRILWSTRMHYEAYNVHFFKGAVDSTFPAPLNNLVNYTMNSRGRSTAMEFVLNAQEYDYCDGGSNDGIGFEMQVHARDVQPVIIGLMDNVIQLTPGTEITVSIKEAHIVRETESSGRCTSKNDLEYFQHLQHYDQNACFTECITKKIKATCGCIPEFAPGRAFLHLVEVQSTMNLTVEESLKYVASQVCVERQKITCVRGLVNMMIIEKSLAKQCSRCKTPCIQKNYVVQTTENIFPAKNALHIYADYKYPKINYTALMQVSDYPRAIDVLRYADTRTYNLSTKFESIEEARNSLIYLRVQLEDMNIMVTRETFAVSTSELFTQLGGAISLFVGASVLSFIECFYWTIIPDSLRGNKC